MSKKRKAEEAGSTWQCTCRKCHEHQERSFFSTHPLTCSACGDSYCADCRRCGLGCDTCFWWCCAHCEGSALVYCADPRCGARYCAGCAASDESLSWCDRCDQVVCRKHSARQLLHCADCETDLCRSCAKGFCPSGSCSACCRRRSRCRACSAK